LRDSDYNLLFGEKVNTYYDDEKQWGKEVNEHNRLRLEDIVACVPDGISTVMDVGCGDGLIGNRLIKPLSAMS
jgi:hypothetical protein